MFLIHFILEILSFCFDFFVCFCLREKENKTEGWGEGMDREVGGKEVGEEKE